ncbi:carbon-nitrogen hydrolase family protein [Asticcacaulis sp. EMRT-3]|uniref:carbon-nitrogen hydrolase family protein n=1 Tax=Asticcacaulis sp. EMRT-3 TaxID=3040349 RepID=UPI0024AF83A2|nr:carbon-nitrogen hydrolase family protein [Asticcacaulis sp. EMRT-3]MDI7775333.1 carbon-nitrogen hydrolase family protein [Asticcacaulis sp. EMRT-3]
MADTVLSLALVQLRTPADPVRALEHARPLILKAAGNGAQFILLPECANLVESRHERKAQVVGAEDEDVFIAGIRELAKGLRVPILIGSAIVKAESDAERPDAPRNANRSLLVNGHGDITARYDKIHLFDADTPDGKSYRESATMRPGDRAVVAQTPWGGLGLSVCYDMRFAHLYRALARQNVPMIAVPAAFTVPTGRAHWEVLLRARAIETGAFVLAPAQGGLHEDGRTTYGHSLVVSPWGEVIARLDHDHPAILEATLDFGEVAAARQALPQLRHDRDYST